MTGPANQLTTSVIVICRTNAPLVPAIVSTNVPLGVLAVVFTVRVPVAGMPMAVGWRPAVAPAGTPVTVSPTVPVYRRGRRW